MAAATNKKNSSANRREEQAEAYVQLLAWGVETYWRAKRRVRKLRRERCSVSHPALLALFDSEIASATGERDSFAKGLAACSQGTASLWTIFASSYAITAKAARKLSAADVKTRRGLLSREYPFRSARKGAKGDAGGPLVDSARASLRAAIAVATDHLEAVIRHPAMLDEPLPEAWVGADPTAFTQQPITDVERAVKALHRAAEVLRNKTTPRPRQRIAVPTHLVGKLGESIEVLDPRPHRTAQLRIHAELKRLHGHEAVARKRRGTLQKRGGVRSAAMMLVALVVFGDDDKGFRTVEKACAAHRKRREPEAEPDRSDLGTFTNDHDVPGGAQRDEAR